MPARRFLLLVIVGALALSACDVDATVTVAMRHDGSGVVRIAVALDRAAVRAAEIGNGTLAARVRIGDLTAAGWRVAPWTRNARGGASLVVAKRFSRPAEIASIMREVSGTRGPFRDFTASRRASTFSTHWRINGIVDLRGLGVGVADDPALVASLTGERVDIPQIEARVSDQLKHLHLHVVTVLPHDGRREVTVTPGRRTPVTAAADDTNFNRVALFAVGIAFGVVALLLLVVGERRARRRRGSVASGPSHPRRLEHQ